MRKAPLISAIVLLVGLVFVYTQAIGDKPVSTVNSADSAVSACKSASAKGCYAKKQTQARLACKMQKSGCSKDQADSPQCAKAKAAAAQSGKNGSGCCARKQAAQAQSACGDKAKGCPKPKPAQDSEKVSL